MQCDSEINNSEGTIKVFFAENKTEMNDNDSDDELYFILKHDSDICSKSDLKKKQHTGMILGVGLLVSILIIVGYTSIYQCSKVCMEVKMVLSILFQLALAYCSSMIFYCITVILPKKNRAARVAFSILCRVDNIAYSMEIFFNELKMANMGEDSILIDFEVESSAGDINSINSDTLKRLPLKSYLIENNEKIRQESKELLEFFYSDISIDLIQLLEETIHAYFSMEEFMHLVYIGAKIELINGSVAFGEYESIIKRLRRMDKKAAVS